MNTDILPLTSFTGDGAGARTPGSSALVHFEAAGYADLVNRVIEVNEGLEVRAYTLPPE
jgi:hypothetical protein